MFSENKSINDLIQEMNNSLPGITNKRFTGAFEYLQGIWSLQELKKRIQEIIIQFQEEEKGFTGVKKKYFGLR